ncbi:hypothetical protein [Streptomyces sp. WZ.A104]|nr:hypothetical protein [Streptomyces sp. WZ.A104]
MRTLAITRNVTLDGSVEMITDWFALRGGRASRCDEAAELAQ